jgi:hypothetical protein
MESILKSFPLGMFFRGVFPGGFFVISYVVAVDGWESLADINSDHVLSTWLWVAAFAGIAVYTVHRSAFYPFIECWLDKRCMTRRQRKCPWIRTETVERLLTQWTLGGSSDKKKNADVAEHIAAWADYTHFQYASAWCIGLGSLFGHIVGRCPNAKATWELDCPLILLAFGLLFSALLSDWRLRTVFRRAVGNVRRRSRPAGKSGNDGHGHVPG